MTFDRTGFTSPGVFTTSGLTSSLLNGSAIPTGGGGEGITYSKITVSGGLMAPDSSYDQAIDFGFERGLVDYARFEKIDGDASSAKVVLYDGDPAGSGTAVCPIYGGTFSTWNIPAGSVAKGLNAAYGGSNGITSPVGFDSPDLYVRVTNADYSYSGNFVIQLYAREIVEPT